MNGLPIESYEIIERDGLSTGDITDCTVTVKLVCGLMIDGYVDVNNKTNQPDWNTFDPIYSDISEESDFGL